jgi:hypothetical protein
LASAADFEKTEKSLDDRIDRIIAEMGLK